MGRSGVWTLAARKVATLAVGAVLSCRDLAYYLRAFCTSDDIPPLRAVFEWAVGQGVRLDSPEAELDSSTWLQAEILYKRDRSPIVAETNTDDLVREEVGEFIESLEDVDESPEKQKVLEHLRQTKAIVAVQLLGDIDDDGYSAAGTFLTYFVEHCAGLIQADGEGFYERERLIVELD